LTKVRTALGLGLLVLVVGVVAGGVGLLLQTGAFRHRTAHFAGTCQELALGASAGSLEIDRPRGLVYLSYLDRRALAAGQRVFGTVMLVDLDTAEPRPRAAITNDPPGFRPEGLSLYAPPSGPGRLFVVSHRPGKPTAPGAAAPPDETVEVFEQSPSGSFRPIATLRDPLLVRPHALAAVGPDQFYVTNDSGASNWLERSTAVALRRGLSTVDYYDGKVMRAVLTGLASATGIAVSPDGGRVYVGEALARRIDVYTREAGSGALTLERRIELGSAPAAIEVDAAGSLWVAAHPGGFPPWRRLDDPSPRSPTQVLRISPPDWTPQEVYFEPGERLSAGSVAAVAGKTLLIGSTAERRLLRCTLP
jgi:arylesterase/paraoxonase